MSGRKGDWAGDPNKLAAQLRRTAKVFNPKLLLAQLLRDAADQIDCATTPSQRLDAATVERCAQVAESIYCDGDWLDRDHAANAIATAIRALGNKETDRHG